MKKLLTILLLIMLIISFFQITNMYALYKEELQGDYTNLLGVWAIKVNKTKITDIESEDSEGENLTFDMTEENLAYIDSPTVANGKIAPGTQAFFEIVIDPTNTDVSIVYKLDIKLSSIAEASLKLVNVENYFQKDGDPDTARVTNDDIYTGVEDHTAIIPMSVINGGYKNHVKLYFEWENVEENNESDSIIGSTEGGGKITIPLEINLKQYTGEVIGDGTS